MEEGERHNLVLVTPADDARDYPSDIYGEKGVHILF